MDSLFNKEWWQILLILLTTAGSLGFLLYIIVRINGFIKLGKFSFGGPKHKITPSKHQDYLEFCLIFKELITQMKTKFRQYCLENGMETFNKEEWSDYKVRRMDQLGKMAFQFMTEQYGDKTIILSELLEYKINQNDEPISKILKKETDLLFNVLRGLTEETNEVSISKNLELVNYMDIKIRNIDKDENITSASIIEVVMNCGRRMVEIHELKNRDLIKKQMTKVEETLLMIYAEITIRYLSLLQKKLNE
jgi:hypothetical protein